MNLKMWSVGIVVLMASVLPMSASALGISVASVTTSTGAAFLADGDTVTIDLVVENATNEEIFGLGLGITGYDVGNDGTAFNNHLVLAGGSVANSIFDVIPGNFGGVGLTNLRTAPFEQGMRPPFNDPLRVSLFNGASLSGFDGNGTIEDGVDGNSIASGDVHFRVIFAAQSLGLQANESAQFTLDIGTGFFGNVAIGAGGDQLAFQNTSVTLTVVPEPGTALLMGLGLMGLAARRR